MRAHLHACAEKEGPACHACMHTLLLCGVACSTACSVLRRVEAPAPPSDASTSPLPPALERGALSSAASQDSLTGTPAGPVASVWACVPPQVSPDTRAGGEGMATQLVWAWPGGADPGRRTALAAATPTGCAELAAAACACCASARRPITLLMLRHDAEGWSLLGSHKDAACSGRLCAPPSGGASMCAAGALRGGAHGSVLALGGPASAQGTS